MLKTDSVLNIINMGIDIEHRQCQYQYSTDKCGCPKEQERMLKTYSVLNMINIYVNKAQTNSMKWIQGVSKYQIWLPKKMMPNIRGTGFLIPRYARRAYKVRNQRVCNGMFLI